MTQRRRDLEFSLGGSDKVSRQTITRFESGKSITLDNFLNLCDYLGCEVSIYKRPVKVEIKTIE